MFYFFSGYICQVNFNVFYLKGSTALIGLIESQATMIKDIKVFQNSKIEINHFILCLAILVVQLPFTTDVGFFIIDIIHHYLFYYVVPFIALIQCLAIGNYVFKLIKRLDTLIIKSEFEKLDFYGMFFLGLSLVIFNLDLFCFWFLG